MAVPSCKLNIPPKMGQRFTAFFAKSAPHHFQKIVEIIHRLSPIRLFLIFS